MKNIQENPVLHGGEGDYLSCGHGTVVKTPDGKMFYMCHAYLKGEGFLCRTPTCSAGNGDDSRPLGALYNGETGYCQTTHAF